MVWVDPDRARQILLNLVMNAVKYATAAGGHITLSFATTPQTVSIHVADTGPGFQARSWWRSSSLVQLANGLTERRGGVGLGLTISRDLARAMKGDLTSRAPSVSARRSRCGYRARGAAPADAPQRSDPGKRLAATSAMANVTAIHRRKVGRGDWI